MPNWAEGVIKIRGTRADIKKFLFEALNPVPVIHQAFASLDVEKVHSIEPSIEEDEFDFQMHAPNGFHIEGTRRAFIDGSIVWFFEDRHKEILSIDSFKQAWCADAREYAEISKKYNLDIKIHTFEQGMEFNQHIEIINGEIIKDKDIQFDDYKWECVFPDMGG